MRARLFLALLLAAGLPGPGARALHAGQIDGEYGWPLSLDRALSSTFGETRPTAFHAGIDLKTWGQTGCEVRSAADGWVGRVRTSPWGYGRCLYLKTIDGRTLVYAHLQGFAPGIAERVERAQQEKLQYTVDLSFTETEFPMRRGQVVAFSGQSGAGPPHLHVELRDADNAPLNPLTHGFRVRDTVPPSMPRLGLVPLGLDGQVDGGHAPRVVALSWEPAQGCWAAADTPQVWGRVGVAVVVHDQADAAQNHLAPYRVVLLVDGRQVFAATYERFSYAENHQVWLDRGRLDLDAGGAPFHNLFRLPGNRLGFYEVPDGENGSLHCGTGLSHGLHLVEVEAADVAGNRCRGRLWLRVDAVPRISQVRLTEEGGRPVLRALAEDADDRELEVALERADGESWRTVESRTVAAGPLELAEGEVWRTVDTRTVAAGPLEWFVPERGGLWRVRVRDHSGAESWAAVGTPESGGSREPLKLTVERQVYAQFVDLCLRAGEVLAELPRVRAFSGGQEEELAARQVARREWTVSVPLVAGEGPEVRVRVQVRGLRGGEAQTEVVLAQQPVEPGHEARLSWADGQAGLTIAVGCAYERLFPQAEAITPAASVYLESTGVGYAFEPQEASFDQPVEVWLRYPSGTADPEKLGLYQEGRTGEWGFVGNELDSAQARVGARVRRLGRLALFADRQPPDVEVLQPAEDAVLAEQRPSLVARVQDHGAGIGREEDLRLEVDGQKLVSEYDPDANTLEGRPPQDLAPGPHRLLVWVRDRSGNEATAQVEFAVAPAGRQ